jgi:glycosyltransferase involved in cell wall biosynthesis
MTGVLIPALNCAKTIGQLLSGLQRHVAIESILVVDDGSSDETAAIARAAGAIVLSHGVNRGKGAALRTGFQYVLSASGHDSVITMDADLQHDPEDVPKFLTAWQSGNYDLILGYRQKIGSGMPLHRAISNSITSALVSARTGVRIRDSQTGFRLIARSVLATIEFQADGYEAETEILIKAARRGFRIGGVPIATIYDGAPSHMTHWKTTKRFLQVLLKEYK